MTSPPPSGPPRRDPLESALFATLFFGGVFLIAFLVNVVRWALGLRAASASSTGDPAASQMILGWLGFALASGVSVAVARRHGPRRRKNLVTGLIVGFCYAAACLLTFGELEGGLGFVTLAIAVWGGVAWAVSSGLQELGAPFSG